jgi:mRNA-degrading endonuclease toxin of MazEF toxin-antitoxin module
MAVLIEAGTAGLREHSLVLVCQARALDLKRFQSKVGDLPPELLATVLDQLADFLDYSS